MKRLILFAIILSTILFLTGCPKRYSPSYIPNYRVSSSDTSSLTNEGSKEARFNMHAKCLGATSLVCDTDLKVEVGRGSNSRIFDCIKCTNVPVNVTYLSGKENEYYVKMTAYKSGGSETQSLSLKKILEAVDYPNIVFAYKSLFCDCFNNSTTTTSKTTKSNKQNSSSKNSTTEKIKQHGPHWDE